MNNKPNSFTNSVSNPTPSRPIGNLAKKNNNTIVESIKSFLPTPNNYKSTYNAVKDTLVTIIIEYISFCKRNAAFTNLYVNIIAPEWAQSKRSETFNNVNNTLNTVGHAVTNPFETINSIINKTLDMKSSDMVYIRTYIAGLVICDLLLFGGNSTKSINNFDNIDDFGKITNKVDDVVQSGNDLLKASNKQDALKTLNKLPKTIQDNAKRFFNKTSNAYKDFKVELLKDGTYRFTVTKPGNVPNSSAVYTKIVDKSGNTIKTFKTTYAPDGSIIHIKDK